MPDAAALLQPGIRDERGLALVGLLDRLDQIPIERLLVYLFDEVDASALPHLVDQFDMHDFVRETTPNAAVRALLKGAIDLKRHLGTRWAVEYVCTALGVPIEFTDWHETVPQGPRHTFSVIGWANDATVVLSAGIQRELIKMIRAAKRLSQHETVSVGAQLGSVLGIAAAAEAGVFLDTDAPSSGRDRATASLGLAAVADACVTLDTGAAVGGRVATGAILGLGGVVIPLQLTDVWG